MRGSLSIWLVKGPFAPLKSESASSKVAISSAKKGQAPRRKKRVPAVTRPSATTRARKAVFVFMFCFLPEVDGQRHFHPGRSRPPCRVAGAVSVLERPSGCCRSPGPQELRRDGGAAEEELARRLRRHVLDKL